MEEVLVNELGHDGMRKIVAMSDRSMLPGMDRWLGIVPECARDLAVYDETQDAALGIFQLEIKWPVYEVFEVAIDSPKKFRRVIMVHYKHAERVSDCIKLAVDAFERGIFCRPKYAWVREIPPGAEDGMQVHGVLLLKGEIAPANCVLVGGME